MKKSDISKRLICSEYPRSSFRSRWRFLGSRPRRFRCPVQISASSRRPKFIIAYLKYKINQITPISPAYDRKSKLSAKHQSDMARDNAAESVTPRQTEQSDYIERYMLRESAVEAVQDSEQIDIWQGHFKHAILFMCAALHDKEREL